MSTHPEGGGLGDPRDTDRDGMLHRDPAPEESTDPEVDEVDDITSPEVSDTTSGPVECDIDYSQRSMRSVFWHYENTPTHYYPENESLAKIEMIEPMYKNDKFLSDLIEKPSIDGSDYAEEAFGGFGPGSPEYDHERRLQILVPDPEAAVSWFKEAVIKPGYSAASKIFSTSVPEALHPGVKELEVTFSQSSETSLISAKIRPHIGALKVDDAPKRNETGLEIDTFKPAKKMLTTHIKDRLEALYPDQVRANKSANDLIVELGNDINLHIETDNLPNLDVTVNGSNRISLTRYGTTQPTPRQLEKELQALKDHFPNVAEAYADFFRQQLPKTQIEVDYKSAQTPGQEHKSAAAQGKESGDPINPQRMAQLRQELIVEPREDDFKYIGGLDSDIAKLQEAAMGFSNPEAFREFGVTPPRGILLQGPPGTGKTSLAMAFARDAEAVVLNVKASTIKSAFHGETERNIRGVFQLADELVEEGERVVVFIDELESLAPARDSMGASNIDKNVTTELLQGMNVDRKNSVIMAATNVPGMVDPALTNNSSRFSQQLEIGLPDSAARADIIEKLFNKFFDKSTRDSREELFDPAILIETLAQGSEGLSGADLESAIRKVLFAKAVMFASTGEKPGPSTNGQIYQSIKNVAVAKENTGQNYL